MGHWLLNERANPVFGYRMLESLEGILIRRKRASPGRVPAFVVDDLKSPIILSAG